MNKLACLLSLVGLAACHPSQAGAPGHAPDRDLGGLGWGRVEVVTAPDGRIAQVVPGPDGSEIRVDGIVVAQGQGRPGRPVFSPDGRRLAYVGGQTGVASLWILDLVSGAEVQLTNVGLKPGAGLGPSFIPPPVRVGTTLWTDSGQLIWDAGDSVWACADDGKGCRRLSPTQAVPASADNGAVSLVGPDGVVRRVLVGS